MSVMTASLSSPVAESKTIVGVRPGNWADALRGLLVLHSVSYTEKQMTKGNLTVRVFVVQLDKVEMVRLIARGCSSLLENITVL